MARWKERIGMDGFKIDIGWQGNPNGQDNHKDIPLEEFIPLTRIPQVRLISLQYRDGVDQTDRISDMGMTGLACVKTHTSAKCRKNNSPSRYRS